MSFGVLCLITDSKQAAMKTLEKVKSEHPFSTVELSKKTNAWLVFLYKSDDEKKCRQYYNIAKTKYEKVYLWSERLNIDK